MRGHEQLIALRRAGKAPGLVFVHIGRDPMRTWCDWASWSAHAHLEVDPTESIATLDLRCLVGLTVMVSGLDEHRVLALHEACVAASAKRAIGAAYRPAPGGDLEIVAGFDSATAEG